MNRSPLPTVPPTTGAPTLAVRRGISAFLAGWMATSHVPTSGQTVAQDPTPLPAVSSTATASPSTNPPVADTPAADPTADAIRQLLRRIQDLERREAERAHAETNAAQELVQTLQRRILDLETKLQSFERSVVVPELAATPEPGPSNADLDQQIRIVDRKREIAEEEAEARRREMPQLSIGPAGFVMRSADTNFLLRIRGLIQADSRTFFDDNTLDTGNSGFLLRRARVGLEGTVFRDFDFQFNAELGDGGLGASNLQVLDANVSYRFQPDLRLRAGHARRVLHEHHRLLQGAAAHLRRVLRVVATDAEDGRWAQHGVLRSGRAQRRRVSPPP